MLADLFQNIYTSLFQKDTIFVRIHLAKSNDKVEQPQASEECEDKEISRPVFSGIFEEVTLHCVHRHGTATCNGRIVGLELRLGGGGEKGRGGSPQSKAGQLERERNEGEGQGGRDAPHCLARLLYQCDGQAETLTETDDQQEENEGRHCRYHPQGDPDLLVVEKVSPSRAGHLRSKGFNYVRYEMRGEVRMLKTLTGL